MEEENYGRSSPGCMKGLVHFLNLHHHLHLRKMKLLAYRKHGEGKRAARNKEPKTDPDAPSTSQQYVCTEDACLGVEDKASIRKQPVKSSMRISIDKWKSREHNKKRKASLPTPRLLRTQSIHHWSEDHVDNVNFGFEISVIKQNVDLNKASSSSERACCFDEHNFEKQCDENMAYSKNGPFGPRKPDDLESTLQIKQQHLSNTLNEVEVGSFAKQHKNAKKLQGDVILHPSKEFLAMMKLFNGNIELIRNILDDPSFIFAHYLQAKQASKAELTRAYSFPSSPLLERKNDGHFRINHTNFESESLAKQSYKFHSENSRASTDIIQDDTTNAEMMDGDEERNPKLVETNNHSAVLVSSSILQNVRNNPPNSNQFLAIKHNKKEHHRIFMDGILHKIPFGRRVIESMKKSKFGWWDGLTIEKPDGEGLVHACWNKSNKNVKKNIHRSQSLNDSLVKYSHLYDSISKEEFERLPESRKVKPLGRIFSLPDITYCSSSKNAQSEAPFSSPKNLTTSHTEEILEKEESEEFTTQDSSKWIVTDCWKIPLQSNEKEQSETCQILKKLAKDGLIREENSSVTPQGENLLDEAHTYEPTKPILVSATGALARGLEHRYPSEHSSLFDNNAADGLVDTNEIDLAKAKLFPDIDCFDSLHLRIDQKDEATFNYVREILTRSGFCGSGFLGACNSPYQPMDPLIFNQGEDLSHELDITEDEHDILSEHQLLFDLINEAWVELYEKYFVFFSPWLSRFNTNNRPMPMGDHILEEIWANICWHLKRPPQPDITLEDIVSRNFTKNDGWMNIQYDIEDVELDLECLILDALLDDGYLMGESLDEAMADIIAMFSRWAKSALSDLLDGSSSSSAEPTGGNALDDFQRIMRMLPRIEAVLEDAEEREIQDRSVNLWLSELRLLAYDIDDVIDEYEYVVLATQMEARAAEESYHHGKCNQGNDERHDPNEHVEGLNRLASSSSKVPAISDGMIEKLREIRERFDEIERDRKGLRLREEDGVRRTVNAQNSRQTSSLVDESSIIGRESEKEEIVKLLLSDLQVSNKITVIPVVGMGGVGKTTLAQLIYNDPRIRQYFDLHIWIYVSEDFDPVKLTKDIYRSMTKKSCEEDVGFDYLQDSIKKELMKFERAFFVLDDVWNEKQCLWESLKVPLYNAGIVNILLTTRNEKVADVIRTMNYFRLGFLSEDEGLRLFKQYSLCGDETLMRIGQKIVNKCGGLPLAIKLLGSHLRFEKDEDKWMSILESELWDLDPGTNEIFPALKLSYQRLPIPLKPCFRYCSLFPKKCIPDKNHLVWLWMAQGYIQPKIRGKTMEEIGREYFDELLGRSFFQATEFTEYFKMHDLVYDLAVSISDNESIIVKSERGNQNKCISNNAFHLATHDEPTNNEALKATSVFPFLSKHVALRSIFCYGRRIINDFQLLDSIRLRVLHIKIDHVDSKPSKFLGSIASMKHLRYLYICCRSLMDLSRLSISLHSMGNVQVLDLFGCHYSIEDLASLTGSCCINNIYYANNVEDVKKANINGKKHIQRLFIDWGKSVALRCSSYVSSFDVFIYFSAMVRVEKKSSKLEEVKLEALRPHNNLKELSIRNYPVILFPLWLGDPSYSKLQDITLERCNKWDGSGRVLDRDLPCLQSISIIDCAMLKNIKIVQYSSSLRRLLVEDCPKVTSLLGLWSLHGLEKLEIRGCYNLLISKKEILPSKLQFVCFQDCWELTSIPGLQNLPSLKELELKRCWKLEFTLEEKLSSMPSVLEIVDCPGLENWCQRYGYKFIELSRAMVEMVKDPLGDQLIIRTIAYGW